MAPAIAVPTETLGAGMAPIGVDMTHLDSEMIELALLVPRWQAIAFEALAKQRGVSAGQMMRRMISAVVGAGPAIKR
jgi:hypothetical protein